MRGVLRQTTDWHHERRVENCSGEVRIEKLTGLTRVSEQARPGLRGKMGVQKIRSAGLKDGTRA
jgi:hypothetical protein